jgi:predicted DNA-binding protein (MmcQ/YjbR family)
MKWLQVYEDGALSDDSLKEHIEESYRLVAAGMSKKKRAELGIA